MDRHCHRVDLFVRKHGTLLWKRGCTGEVQTMIRVRDRIAKSPRVSSSSVSRGNHNFGFSTQNNISNSSSTHHLVGTWKPALVILTTQSSDSQSIQPDYESSSRFKGGLVDCSNCNCHRNKLCVIAFFTINHPLKLVKVTVATYISATKALSNSPIVSIEQASSN